jgi:hypothetical protein
LISRAAAIPPPQIVVRFQWKSFVAECGQCGPEDALGVDYFWSETLASAEQ